MAAASDPNQSRSADEVTKKSHEEGYADRNAATATSGTQHETRGEVPDIDLQQYYEKLLDIVLKMQVKQEAYNSDLSEFYRREALESERANELFREVLENEAESIASAKFQRWMFEREKFGVGLENIQKWFLNEGLTVLTPYAAVVPFPHGLSNAALETVTEVIDEMKLGTFFAEFHPLREKSKQSPAFQCGAGVLNWIASEAQADVRQHLTETTCLFLNDSNRPSVHATSFVVQANHIAMQINAKESIDASHIAAISRGVREFMARKVIPLLQQRSFVGQMRITPKDNSNVSASDVFLLNLSVFDARDCGLFSWKDLLALAKTLPSQPEIRVCIDDASSEPFRDSAVELELKEKDLKGDSAPQMTPQHEAKQRQDWRHTDRGLMILGAVSALGAALITSLSLVLLQHRRK